MHAWKSMKVLDNHDLLETERKEILIQNCWYFWSHSLILIFCFIPLISHAISSLFSMPLWTVPKIFELKIYASIMLSCLLLPIFISNFPKLFHINHPKYYQYIAFFYPASCAIFSCTFLGNFRYLFIFTMGIVGIFILFSSLSFKKNDSLFISLNQQFKQRYLFLSSQLASIFLIIYLSQETTFNLFSIITLLAFVTILSFIRYIQISEKYLIILLACLLWIITFGSMQKAMEVTHYSFFLGPVIEVIYGQQHPLNIDIQYGGGLTTFLAAYFKTRGQITFIGLEQLLTFLTFVQYFLVFYIAYFLYQSAKIAFLTLGAILCFSFFAPNIKYYYCAPSMSFLRFGLMYFVLFCYALQQKHIISHTFSRYCTAIIASIAFWWSFESAIYTLPALFLAEYYAKQFRSFIFTFLICFSVITTIYFLPFIVQGSKPNLFHYYEYALVYASGFGQIPLSRSINFWWLFPLLYAYFLIKIALRQISNKIILALTVYGVMIFTYFAGRAHPILLNAVSIPFILLSVYFVLNLKHISLYLKQILVTLTLLVFPSSYYALDHEHTILQGIININIPILRNFILSGKNITFLISDSGSPWLNGEATAEKSNCLNQADLLALTKYTEHHQIAILSTDDKHLIHFYACTQSHNAFSINPYYETALNPKAVSRAVKRAPTMINQYLLIESELLKHQPDLWGSRLAYEILHSINTIKIGEETFAGQKISVYLRKDGVSGT